jgi:hypothetical protein
MLAITLPDTEGSEGQRKVLTVVNQAVELGSPGDGMFGVLLAWILSRLKLIAL